MITIVNVEENSYEAIGSRVGLSRKSHMFDSAKEQEVAKYFFFHMRGRGESTKTCCIL